MHGSANATLSSLYQAEHMHTDTVLYAKATTVFFYFSSKQLLPFAFFTAVRANTGYSPYAVSMLAIVFDAGPTSKHHWMNTSCLPECPYVLP